MNHTSYKIDLPQDPKVVVFLNGIKALKIEGFFWLWQQIFTTSVKDSGCIETKLSICSSFQEAIIVSYWQDEASLMQFFHSPSHRQMMKNMTSFIKANPGAIAVYNETYRPLRSGQYLNEPQGLAKVYPAIDRS